jgi:hypothetical protein
MKKNKNEMIEGVLNPISWDNNNNIREFSIYTSEGEDVPVKCKSCLTRFGGLLNKLVRAKGEIHNCDDGHRVIELRNLHSLKKKNFKNAGFIAEDDLLNVLFPKAAFSYGISA